MRQLKQGRLLNGKRIFEIVDKEKIRVKFSALGNSSEETVNIFDIDEKYERIHYRELKWLILAVLALLPTVRFMYDAIVLSQAFPLSFAGFFLALTMVLVGVYVYKHQDQVVFRFRHNNEVALVLWSDNPNKEVFDGFLNVLMNLIKKAYIHPEVSDEERVEIYAKHLEFLFSEGVLSENEARQIMDRTIKRMKAKKASSVVSIVK